MRGGWPRQSTLRHTDINRKVSEMMSDAGSLICHKCSAVAMFEGGGFSILCMGKANDICILRWNYKSRGQMSPDDEFELSDELREQFLANAGSEMLTVWIPLPANITDADVEWAKAFGERLNRDLTLWQGGASSISTRIDHVGIGFSGRAIETRLQLITPTLKRHCPSGTYIFMEDLNDKWPSKKVALFKKGEHAPQVPLGK